MEVKYANGFNGTLVGIDFVSDLAMQLAPY